MSDRIALFDMDETIVDFTGPLRERLARTFSPGEEMPPDLFNMPMHMYERIQAIKKEPGFWRNLPPLAWGMELMSIFREKGYEIHIVSKGPTTGAIAWSEKVEWVEEHLTDVTLHLTQNKAMIQGDVFIEDRWDFLKAWLTRNPRGYGIMNKLPPIDAKFDLVRRVYTVPINLEIIQAIL